MAFANKERRFNSVIKKNDANVKAERNFYDSGEYFN